MQQVMPICLGRLMQEEICISLLSLGQMFNKIYSKVIDLNIMQMLRDEVAKIMSTIDKVFPPTTFDVMTHLVVQLVEKLVLCGLVQTRWMYLIKQYMKGYV